VAGVHARTLRQILRRAALSTLCRRLRLLQAVGLGRIRTVALELVQMHHVLLGDGTRELFSGFAFLNGQVLNLILKVGFVFYYGYCRIRVQVFNTLRAAANFSFTELLTFNVGSDVFWS
jgi:hypothetical protein